MHILFSYVVYLARFSSILPWYWTNQRVHFSLPTFRLKTVDKTTHVLRNVHVMATVFPQELSKLQVHVAKKGEHLDDNLSTRELSKLFHRLLHCRWSQDSPLSNMFDHTSFVLGIDYTSYTLCSCIKCVNHISSILHNIKIFVLKNHLVNPDTETHCVVQVLCRKSDCK